METWHHLTPEESLALIDADYGDPYVRMYATKAIAKMNDSELAHYMMQIIQALKYEVHHKSSLSEMILERALKNPRIVGQSFYWQLRTSMYDKTTFERLFLQCERFLMLCGKFKNDLYNQHFVNQRLVQLNIDLTTEYEAQKTHPDVEEKVSEILKDRLRKLNLDIKKEGLQLYLPLFPKYRFKSFLVNDCLVFKSKKRPILLKLALDEGELQPANQEEKEPASPVL